MSSARFNGLLAGVQNYLRAHWRGAFQLRERLILSGGVASGHRWRGRRDRRVVNLLFFHAIEAVKLSSCAALRSGGSRGDDAGLGTWVDSGGGRAGCRAGVALGLRLVGRQRPICWKSWWRAMGGCRFAVDW